MPEERLSGGRLAAAISNVVVRTMAEVSGRGPSRARTTISRDSVFVVVEDALTQAERELVRIGDTEVVLRGRQGLQRAMHGTLNREIERLAGREVIGFMSTNHIEPDLAVEIFILAPEDSDGRLAQGDSTL
ncbi:MAG TPA: Na-translocating system protein MpsC family protein [Solirubrobacteraceae bacterium]